MLFLCIDLPQWNRISKATFTILLFIRKNTPTKLPPWVLCNLYLFDVTIKCSSQRFVLGVNHKIKNCHFISCLGTIVKYDNIWVNISKNIKFKVRGHLICILMSKQLGFLVLLVTVFYAYILTSFWSVFGHKLTKYEFGRDRALFSKFYPFSFLFSPQNQIFHFGGEKTRKSKISGHIKK